MGEFFKADGSHEKLKFTVVVEAIFSVHLVLDLGGAQDLSPRPQGPTHTATPGVHSDGTHKML